MNAMQRLFIWRNKKASKRKKSNLRKRLDYVMLLDRTIEGSNDFVRLYLTFGPYWYNCIKSPEPLWWVSKNARHYDI